MWGRHVEGELRNSQKGAKSDKQAAMKVEMRFRTLMQEVDEDGEVVNEEHKDFPKHLQRTPAPTRFRDPMTALKKK